MSPPTLSAPSMVFGRDLLLNVQKLSRIVRHVEIVLFHTPELHNIPTAEELLFLQEIKEEKQLTYSVHLPASLEIAAENRIKRHRAVQRATQIVTHMNALAPDYHILHIPITTPTLTAQQGCYIMTEEEFMYAAWADRATKSLQIIQAETGLKQRLLLENINYSPKLLDPIRQAGFCAFCLDIGHLLLGGESVREVLRQYLPAIREIHIHGVVGWDEHLGLEVLPEERVQAWLTDLNRYGYTGILNVEVFDPVDLESSLRVLRKIGPMKQEGSAS
jgi:sugar phosphate isomerase/epimerase